MSIPEVLKSSRVYNKLGNFRAGIEAGMYTRPGWR
jgi:hypothetical protein